MTIWLPQDRVWQVCRGLATLECARAVEKAESLDNIPHYAQGISIS